jgi:hypothetical protein
VIKKEVKQIRATVSISLQYLYSSALLTSSSLIDPIPDPGNFIGRKFHLGGFYVQQPECPFYPQLLWNNFGKPLHPSGQMENLKSLRVSHLKINKKRGRIVVSDRPSVCGSFCVAM